MVHVTASVKRELKSGDTFIEAFKATIPNIRQKKKCH